MPLNNTLVNVVVLVGYFLNMSKSKWLLLFCPHCKHYCPTGYSLRYKDTKGKCRCQREYDLVEPEPWREELKFDQTGYNNSTYWRSMSTGILYPISLKQALKLFKFTVQGCYTSDWQWCNYGGIVTVRPFVPKKGPGIFSLGEEND
jgi:hypothetical protein